MFFRFGCEYKKSAPHNELCGAEIYKSVFSSKLSEADENQHCISECKTQDTNDDTNLHHILLLNETC